MTFAKAPDDRVRRARDAWLACGGSQRETARQTGIAQSTIQQWIRQGRFKDLPGEKPRVRVQATMADRVDKPFVVTTKLPSPDRDLSQLMADRKAEFERKMTAAVARRLIDVAVKIDGPIGIMHFGDPHVDDPGCDIATLERHIAIVNRTEGMFGANVGDLQNLWIGRLAHLHANQTATAREAWTLVEWLVTSVHWLYLIKGNHDLWSGSGDPLDWIVRGFEMGVTEPHGARLNLKFPNGRAIRVNARHDFKGHSMWNTVHGASKAAQQGWRDHILTCGHKHTSGYNTVMDPATGLLSHCIRVGAYKKYDDYAQQEGMLDQNFTPCMATIIDPDATDETKLIQVIFSPEHAADYLTYLRRRA